MHMHSHPMLCLLFPGHRSTSSSVRLSSLARSLSLWAPEASASSPLVLISPELIEFSFLWESSQEGCVSRERRVMERMRETEGDQWQKPRGHSCPRGMQSPVSWGMQRPRHSDLYLYPLSVISQHFRETSCKLLARFRQMCFLKPITQGRFPPHLSSLCLQS